MAATVQGQQSPSVILFHLLSRNEAEHLFVECIRGAISPFQDMSVFQPCCIGHSTDLNQSSLSGVDAFSLTGT